MKPINEQINPNILIQAKKLTQFMQLLQNILPIECRNHVQVANIRNQNLMLITDSPVWTTTTPAQPTDSSVYTGKYFE